MKDISSLHQPDDSIAFFKDLKLRSEAFWSSKTPDPEIYGFQIQQSSKWNPGLTLTDITNFETKLGIKFTPALKNYYTVMNGLNLPGVNVYGGSQAPAYAANFYRYPEDLPLIKEKINWIYAANKVDSKALIAKNISAIFPVYGHRFTLLDHADGAVLSMYGSDIIYWADNIAKLLVKEIFKSLQLPDQFLHKHHSTPKIHFWLDTKDE